MREKSKGFPRVGSNPTRDESFDQLWEKVVGGHVERDAVIASVEVVNAVSMEPMKWDHR